MRNKQSILIAGATGSIGGGASLQAGTGFRLTDDSISGRHVMQVICKQDGQPFVT
jgi:hypothetical protein